MTTIIGFEQIKESIRNRGSTEGVVKKTACAPPIEIEWFGYNSAIIRFRNDCFNPEIVNLALSRIEFGQDYWRLFKLNNDNPRFNPLSVSYLVVIDKPPKGKIDDAFCQIFSLMTKDVYVRELSVWPSKTSIDELTKVYQIDYSVGATISPRIADTLKAAGIRNAYDLAQLSREELCKIPGMTMQDIFKIEKSLAVRGLFLVTKELPNEDRSIALEG